MLTTMLMLSGLILCGVDVIQGLILWGLILDRVDVRGVDIHWVDDTGG